MKAWFEAGLAPRRGAAGGFAVPAGAVLPKVRVADAGQHVLVGRGARLEALDAAGRVTLVREVRVAGEVRAGAELVVGAGCKLGSIQAAGRVVVQASRAGDIDAAGDVLLLGPCQVGNVRAGGDIVIVGEPKTGRLEPKGRVASRPW